MQKRAPTLGNMLVIILFVLSCFGLLLFLWESFGGPVPLKPKQYRFTVGNDLPMRESLLQFLPEGVNFAPCLRRVYDDVMKGDQTIWSHQRPIHFPVRPHPAVAMVAIDK